MSQGIDPRTGEPVGPEVPDSSAEGVSEAVARAQECAQWLADLPHTRRAGLLRALATALREDESALVRLADAETGLGEPRLTGELARTAAQLDMFADVLDDGAFCEAVIDHADPRAVPPHTDLRRVLAPLGPVAVFAASNFPFAFSVAGGDTASALAAGCPVVVKAHPSHPGLSVRIAELLADALAGAGAPRGVLAVVHGHEAGELLVTDPRITAVGFTGSTRGGRALFDLACSRPDPIPFYGELGSINPVVVTEAALERRGDEIAAGLAGSFTLGAGQFCTKPGAVFVPAGRGFGDQVAEAVSAAEAAPLLNARIRDGYVTGVAALGDVPGVKTLLSARGGAGYCVRPAVLAVDAQVFTEQADVLAEECFGPCTLIVEYAGADELAAALAVLPGSLTGSLHAEPTEPGAAGLLAALRRRVGRVIFNGWPTGVAVTWSQHHGGPWPSTTVPLHTSVGATAVRRFLRPVTYQDVPGELLPAALREDNPLGIPRRVDGVLIGGRSQG
ncbi:NADP-dependent aldehyde dehydrogenase [Saccharopolyspora antimicrobica]|uniref:NADP-dependent aldehyde dehydrogenase n=1 Tax=Saccharopolyspora antimicrobica TaxID=455193 RepID=A0A1I5LXQ1_9PSEU|nr:aldehyde dehydrogenase (NADP(+)) [Saccharopolyspora antimicrobica]RKT89038.1 NADP-dependent aldehyde dehydrogenase [Saccharopolyspora antimicrobica]SFP01536.1 NADP-dependent aldehyde dehydrogenase [Saccharopolyspora antimicrobica]